MDWYIEVLKKYAIFSGKGGARAWYIEVLKKYAIFSGRSRREEYWAFIFFNMFIAFVLVAIGDFLSRQGVFDRRGHGNDTFLDALAMFYIVAVFMAVPYSLAVFIPGIAVTVRRLHDTDRTGWWLLIGLVPLIGGIVLLIFMASDSQPGQNRYGANPKEEEHMPTPNEIQQQIKSIGNADTFGTKKEIRYLSDILSYDESVLALTSGLMKGNTWLIVATNRRIIFLDRGMLYVLKYLETPLEKINSIEQNTEMIHGSIRICDDAVKMEIEMLPKWTVRPFVEAVNRARDALKIVQRGGQHASASSSLGIASQLERLADLRDRGVLSDYEFQIQKNNILGA